MSALPPKADIALHRSECRLCAKSGLMQCSKIAPLFDHLVGEREQLRRNCEAKRLCRLEINQKLKFGGLYDWQVGRPFAFENSPDIDTGLAIGLGYAGAIAH